MKRIPREVIRELIQSEEFKNTGDIMEAIKAMFADVLGEVLEAEMDTQLGYDKQERRPDAAGTDKPKNYRNGHTKKNVKTQLGEVEITVPRDRNGEYEPQIISKYSRNADGMEDKILALYAAGMSQRDIAEQIKNLYGVEISPELVIKISEHSIPQLTEWQSRPLEDVYLFCVDGLNGFREAINATFPQADIQRCIIHQIRSSSSFVSYKDIKAYVADLKLIYGATTEEAAHEQLQEFAEKWDSKYPSGVKSWEDNWDILSTFFAYPVEVRKIIYTTNAIEALHRQFRKVTKNKGSFPNDMSLMKMLYLASQNICKKWTMRYRLLPCRISLTQVFTHSQQMSAILTA